MDWDNTEYNNLLEVFNSTFKLYSKIEEDKLSYDEFFILVNDIRATMFLPKLESNLEKDLKFICDPENNKEITASDFIDNTREAFVIITNPGPKYDKYLKKVFCDFDIDNSGYFETDELKLLCNMMCDNFNLKRCEDWQIMYIINLVDIDGNEKIDFDEFLCNYRKIHLEMQKNKKLKKTNITRTDSFKILEIKNDLELGDAKKKVNDEICKYIIDYMTRNAKYLRFYKDASDQGSCNSEQKDFAGEIANINKNNIQENRNLLPLNHLLNDKEHTDNSTPKSRMSNDANVVSSQVKFEKRQQLPSNTNLPTTNIDKLDLDVKKVKKALNNKQESRNIITEWFEAKERNDLDCFDDYSDLMDIMARYLKIKKDEIDFKCKNSKRCNGSCEFCVTHKDKNTPDVDKFFFRFRNKKVAELKDFVFEGTRQKLYLQNTLKKIENFFTDASYWCDSHLEKIDQNIEDFKKEFKRHPTKNNKDNEKTNQNENMFVFEKSFKDQTHVNKKEFTIQQGALNEILDSLNKDRLHISPEKPLKRQTTLIEKFELTDKIRRSLPQQDFVSPFFKAGIPLIKNEKEFVNQIKELERTYDRRKEAEARTLNETKPIQTDENPLKMLNQKLNPKQKESIEASGNAKDFFLKNYHLAKPKLNSDADKNKNTIWEENDKKIFKNTTDNIGTVSITQIDQNTSLDKTKDESKPQQQNITKDEVLNRTDGLDSAFHKIDIKGFKSTPFISLHKQNQDSNNTSSPKSPNIFKINTIQSSQTIKYGSKFEIKPEPMNSFVKKSDRMNKTHSVYAGYSTLTDQHNNNPQSSNDPRIQSIKDLSQHINQHNSLSPVKHSIAEKNQKFKGFNTNRSVTNLSDKRNLNRNGFSGVLVIDTSHNYNPHLKTSLSARCSDGKKFLAKMQEMTKSPLKANKHIPLGLQDPKKVDPNKAYNDDLVYRKGAKREEKNKDDRFVIKSPKLNAIKKKLTNFEERDSKKDKHCASFVNN